MLPVRREWVDDSMDLAELSLSSSLLLMAEVEFVGGSQTLAIRHSRFAQLYGAVELVLHSLGVDFLKQEIFGNKINPSFPR